MKIFTLINGIALVIAFLVTTASPDTANKLDLLCRTFVAVDAIGLSGALYIKVRTGQ